MGEFLNRKKCDCGKMAVYIYMPGYSDGSNSYSCEDCVSRGCTCNWHYVKEESNFPETDNHNNQPTDEDKPWKWVTHTADEHMGEIKEGEIWVHLDEKGREHTCVEFEYDSEGFEIEMNEDEFER